MEAIIFACGIVLILVGHIPATLRAKRRAEMVAYNYETKIQLSYRHGFTDGWNALKEDPTAMRRYLSDLENPKN